MTPTETSTINTTSTTFDRIAPRSTAPHRTEPFQYEVPIDPMDELHCESCQ